MYHIFYIFSNIVKKTTNWNAFPQLHYLTTLIAYSIIYVLNNTLL